MWALLNKVTSFFGIPNEDKLSKDEEDEIVHDMFSEVSLDAHSVDDSKTYQRLNGQITYANEFMAVIDGKYYFHLKDAISSNLSAGDYVEFMLNTIELVVKNVVKMEIK